MELTWHRIMLGASSAALLLLAILEMQKQSYNFKGTAFVARGKGIRVRALAVTDQADRRSLQGPAAVSFGDNGPYPLGLCQGDCDNDDQCQGDLVCHDRDPGDDVPGCYLDVARRDSRTDFCVSKDAIGAGLTGGGGDDNGSAGGGADSSSGSSSGSDSSSNGSNGASGIMGSEKFGLKLYWQEGYFWQFERFERKWCLRCRSGCRSGVELSIFDCEQISPTDFRLVQYDNIGHEAQIQVNDQNLCLEADTSNNVLFLASCDSSEPNQRFISQGGNFLDGQRFEIVPKMKRDWCITQKHHPKWNEVIIIESCDAAREAQTSYWNKYY